MIKKCTKCGIEKAESEFNWRNKSKGVRQFACRVCTKLEVNATRKDLDGKIKPKYSYPSKVKERKRQLRLWLQTKKKSLSCIICGFSHPAALDFHHRNPSNKTIEITTAIEHGYSINKLEKEIAKCDVLCSNCHRILHYNERGGIV